MQSYELKGLIAIEGIQASSVEQWLGRISLVLTNRYGPLANYLTLVGKSTDEPS